MAKVITAQVTPVVQYPNNVPNNYAANQSTWYGNNANAGSGNGGANSNGQAGPPNYQSYSNNRGDMRGRGRGKGQLGYNQCRLCLMYGHLAKSCPLLAAEVPNTSTHPEAEPNVRPYVPEADPSQQPIFTNHIVSCEGGSTMYLRGKMFGREVYGLLDSGSSRSVVPQMYLPSNVQLKRSSCVLYAVNHTELRVLGEVDFDFEVKGRKLWVRAVVTMDTSSILLGSDFMQVHHLTMKWSKQGPKARIDGTWFLWIHCLAHQSIMSIQSLRMCVCYLCLSLGYQNLSMKLR